jgi:peroxiredoxin
MSQKESLHQIFRDLHAERVRTMDPAKLAININQRKTLVDTADPSLWVKAGDKVKPFDLPEVDGGRVRLNELLERGPVVLVFFRFEGCPACNLALPYYQRNLLPGLRELGASLIALSPQVPGRLKAIKDRHSLQFSVASDLNNELARQFGILYTFDEASQQSSIASGNTIGETTGTGTWELPQPTAVVIGQNGIVRFADVHPDWLLRTEAEPILAAVAELAAPKQKSSSVALGA